LWRSRWNVDWQGKPKFSEKTCHSATFVHHKIPHDQTRVWTMAAAVGSRRLTAWAMGRPKTVSCISCLKLCTRWSLAKTGFEHPFIGPEPACGISVGGAKKAARDWSNRNHKECWESTTGLREAKGLIQGPSARRTEDLLKLNRNQLRWMIRLFTGHCHLKGHLFKLRLANNPICERCLEEDESATRILYHCEAVIRCKISSPEPVFHGTKWLLWRPHR
jgi:hypothetical protein